MSRPLSGLFLFLCLALIPSFQLEARGDETVPDPLQATKLADERLRTALEDWRLKSEDEEAYYARIEEILAGGIADPDLVYRDHGMDRGDGGPRIDADTEWESYLTESLDEERPDFRLGNLLLRYGADPRFEPNGRTSALDSTMIACEPLGLALLRLNGVELTTTEKYVFLPTVTRASDGIMSLIGLDPLGDCPATRAVAVMPLDELVAWLHFPNPYNPDLFLSLYADGVFEELKKAPLYPAALAAARKARRALPTPEEAWVRAGISEGPKDRFERASVEDKQGVKESMVPNPSRASSPGSAGGSGAVPAER